MNNEKDQIKQRVDLVELISEYVKLKKAGSNYKGLCPFHNEKTPSFYVHPEMGIYKCFGCGESGDCFTWLMKMDHLTFPQALQELAKRTGIKLSKFIPDAQTQTREQLLQALSFAREFYHWLLTQHRAGKPALQYLKQRGVSDQAITTFKLGWSPNEWDALLRYLTHKKHFPVPILLKAGLATSKPGSRSAYDRFRGRVMFPLQNIRGQTLGFSGRVIEGVTQGPKDVGKYINTPETEVYHKRELLYGLEITKPEIKKAQQIVVVEGELDAISSWQAGVKQVVAIKGSSLTPEQVTVLKRYTETLILALDMDIAGDKAARHGIQTAEAAGLEVKVVRLAGGKDPDEVARHNPEDWKQQINSAIDVYQFLLESAHDRHGTQTATAKRKVSAEILPILGEISSSVVKAHWIGQLARKLDLKEDVLWQELQKVSRPRPRVTRQPPVNQDISNQKSTTDRGHQKLSRRQQLEELLTASYLQTDLPGLLQPDLRPLFTLPWIDRLLSHLDALIKNGRQLPLTIEQLQQQHPLPEELQPKIAEVLLLQDYQPSAKQTIPSLTTALTELYLKEQIGKIRRQIAQYEQQNQSSKLKQAQQKFIQLSSRLAKIRQNKV